MPARARSAKWQKTRSSPASSRTRIDKLSAISDRLEAGEGTAGKLLRDPSLYTNADQMLVETRGLVKSIRENPKTYLTIHFRVF